MEYIRTRINSMEDDYGRPAKEFWTESCKEYPTITSTLVVFAILSFAPVVSAIALTAFLCFLAVTVCAVGVVALVLCLSVLLSVTLFFSTVTTVVVSGLVRLGGARSEAQEATAERAAPFFAAGSTLPVYVQKATGVLHRASRFFAFPVKSTGWKTRAVAFLLFRNLFGRIFLSRRVRYHPAYPIIFGSNRTPHPLRWVLLDILHFILERGERAQGTERAGGGTVRWPRGRSGQERVEPRTSATGPILGPFSLVVRLVTTVVKVVFMPVRLLGWEAVLAVCVLALLSSPRMRTAVAAKLTRGAVAVGAILPSVTGLSEPVPAEATPAEAEHKEHEMGSSVPLQGTSSTTAVSTPGGTVRARNVPVAA
ncbi:hypothetical protein C8R43DRAFT_1024682 [Mycena crocata]|nr:hypothetical protein C8R43DRAFT_1024682 [Mycena crocata]